MLSKVCGHLYGTAKKVHPIIVKVNQAGPPESYLDGVKRVLEDVIANGGSKKIVNLSWAYPPMHVSVGWNATLLALLKRIEQKGTLIVAASGNDALVRFLDYMRAFIQLTYDRPPSTLTRKSGEAHVLPI